MGHETVWSKVRGVSLALICAVVLGICAVALVLWKKICVPVIETLVEFGHDCKLLWKDG